MAREIKVEELRNLIKDNSLSIVRFYWNVCPVAIKNEADFKKVEAIYQNKLKFNQIEIDSNKLWEEEGNKEFAIKLSPTYIIYKSGKKVWSKDNFVKWEDLEQAIKKFI